MNDRGLDLSVSDLLKNYLFSKARDHLAEVQENWEQVVTSLGQHEIKTFLRHYWLSNNGVVRDKFLYRKICESYETPVEVRRFAKTLRDSAALYGAFDDLESDWWDVFPNDQKIRIKDWLGQIKTFNVSQCYPVMLAALEERETLFEAILRMLTIFTFRYSIIGNLGTGNLEKAMSDAARLLRSDRNCTPAAVFAKLAPLYPSDDAFERQFAEKEITKAAIARYTLSKLNDHLMGDVSLVTSQNPLATNLEHILPQKFDENWVTSFGSHETAQANVYRLGNMTLLRSHLNRRITNAPFSTKLERAYRLDPLKISEPLINCSAWNQDRVKERQGWMASLAKQIWRLDY